MPPYGYPVIPVNPSTGSVAAPPDDEVSTNRLHDVSNTTIATVSPGKIDSTKVLELTRAAAKASRLYPGAVGELVTKELNDYAKFGFRFDQAGFSERLLQQVLETIEPAP